jgi:hypothetical protein
MKTNTKALTRWILGLLVFEAALGAGLYLMGGDATTGPRFRFLLFVVIVNFPGVMVAARLGLLGNGQWASDSDPMVGWAVVFGFSLLFYTACIWGVQAAVGAKRSKSGGSKTTDLDSLQGPGAGKGD